MAVMVSQIVVSFACYIMKLSSTEKQGQIVRTNLCHCWHGWWWRIHQKTTVHLKQTKKMRSTQHSEYYMCESRGRVHVWLPCAFWVMYWPAINVSLFINCNYNIFLTLTKCVKCLTLFFYTHTSRKQIANQDFKKFKSNTRGICIVDPTSERQNAVFIYLLIFFLPCLFGHVFMWHITDICILLYILPPIIYSYCFICTCTFMNDTHLICSVMNLLVKLLPLTLSNPCEIQYSGFISLPNLG